jgi:ABC-type Fe3+ transport system substrate-binding protein
MTALLSLGLALVYFVQPRAARAQGKPQWQQKWENALREAKRESKVVVFAPPGDVLRQALTANFRKAFPDIALEYSAARGDELAGRIRAERDAGIYTIDVVISGTTTANILFKPMKALDPLEPAMLLPEVTDPKHWTQSRLDFSDPATRYNFVFASQVLPPVIYNLNQVKADDIDRLYQLLDPRWQGKIVINDPNPPGPGEQFFRSIWRVLGPDKAKPFFEKLKANAGAVDRDQRRQIEWVARGKYALALGASSTVGEQLRIRGLDFGVLPEFKDYGGWITAAFGSVMLMNKAPHPNAATVFINWLLGREGQTTWTRAVNQPSHRVDVPTDHLPAYLIPKRGVQYWVAYYENEVRRSPEEDKIFKQLFGG